MHFTAQTADFRHFQNSVMNNCGKVMAKIAPDRLNSCLDA